MILGVFGVIHGITMYYHIYTHPFQPISTFIFAAHHLLGGNGGFVPGALQHVLSRLGHLLRTFLGGSRGPIM
jgi:hypothetical protein